MNEMARDALTILGVAEDARGEDQLSSREARVVSLADEAQALLARKYPGVEFTLDNLLLPDYDQTYLELQLRQAAVSSVIRVRITIAEGGNLIRDDYYGYMNTERYEQFLKERFSDLEPDLSVFSTVYCLLDERYDSAFPVDQAADDAAFFAYTWFLLSPSDKPFAVRMEAFTQRIKALGLSGEFTVYALLDPLPAGTTKDQVFQLIPSHTEARPVYSDSGMFSQRGNG